MAVCDGETAVAGRMADSLTGGIAGASGCDFPLVLHAWFSYYSLHTMRRKISRYPADGPLPGRLCLCAWLACALLAALAHADKLVLPHIPHF